ncbi:MAG TPA: hypothetical protein VJ506_05740 [Candidatus Limnocylindrales bacterium]|nr:hypothetical protein [Candidatus Limnocylindrales bacterium]
MRTFRGIAIAVIAFGIAFGYLEAAVVVYLRAAIGAVGVGPPLDQPPFGSYAGVEVVREVATLVMIAAAGWLAGRGGVERLAWAAVVFGTWDVVYYAGLRVMIGWPPTLDTWDVLFLVPSPWVGPVWAPMVVSAALVAVGLGAARRCRAGGEVFVGRVEVVAGLAGGAAVIASFLVDAGRVSTGDIGPWSGWPLFWAGMTVAGLAALRSLRRPLISVGPAIPEG